MPPSGTDVWGGFGERPVATEPRSFRRVLSECSKSIALALAVSVLLLVFFSPSWVAFRAWERVPGAFWQVIPVRRGSWVVEQVADPFVEISDELHYILRWRLLMPMVGHHLGLAPTLVLALAHVGCVLVLAFVVGLGRKRGYSWRECALLAVVSGAGAWFFTSTGWLGYYDSWIMLGSLSVAWVRSRWLLWLACLLTPWVDERFVLAFPLALLVRWISSSPGHHSLSGLVRWLVREASIAVVLVAGYALLRLWLAGRGGSPTLDQYRSAVEFEKVPLGRLLFGCWEGLRAGWIPVLAAVPLLGRERSLPGGLLAVGICGTTLAGLACNNDLSRSASLMLPVLPLGWGFVRATAGWTRWRLGPILGGLALLLPAHHVVSTFTIPVDRIWQEVRLLQDPPWPYCPDDYLEEARRAASDGEHALAVDMATIALGLAGPQSRVGARAIEVLSEVQGGGGR